MMDLVSSTEVYEAQVEGEVYSVHVTFYDSSCTHHCKVYDEEGTEVLWDKVPENLKKEIKNEYPDLTNF